MLIDHILDRFDNDPELKAEKFEGFKVFLG
jgi:hypothetical protein